MELPSDAVQPQLELKDLERLVEFELKRIEDRQRAFGWTPWGLLGALAALGWNLSERSLGSVAWATIGQWWALCILAFGYLQDIRQIILKVGPSAETPPRYFAAKVLLGASRELLLLKTVVKTGASVVVLLSGALPWPFLIYWWPATIAGTLANVSAFFFFNADFPMRRDGGESGLTKLFGVLSPIFDAFGLTAVCFMLAYLTATPIDFESVKMAAILVCSTQVLVWLTTYGIDAPEKYRLVQIRRALGLGELSIQDARRAVDEALHGLPSEEHLRKPAGNFSQCLDGARKAQAVAADRLEKLRGAPPDADTTAAVQEFRACVLIAKKAADACQKAGGRLSFFVGVHYIQDRPTILAPRQAFKEHRADIDRITKTQKTLEKAAKSLK